MVRRAPAPRLHDRGAIGPANAPNFQCAKVMHHDREL